MYQSSELFHDDRLVWPTSVSYGLWVCYKVVSVILDSFVLFCVVSHLLVISISHYETIFFLHSQFA